MRLRTLLATRLGRRHRAIQTRKSRCARNSSRLMLEILEERLAPAVAISQSYGIVEVHADNLGDVIDVATGKGALAILFTMPGGDTVSLDSTFNSQPSASYSLLQIPGTNLYSFVESFGTILDISGPSGDTADTVRCQNQTSGASMVYLGVTNVGTTDFENGDYPFSTTGNLVVSNVGTINFQAGAVVDVGGTGGLTASADTINFQESASKPYTEVNATNSVNLTSANSLTFRSTGVPYLGSVTLNDGPPAGQPFAGDPYITGPDWGSYGYAPGDSIKIMNAGALSSGPYTVAPGGIIGHNMYLEDPTNKIGTLNGANLSGSFTYVTVQCSGFTPEIQAGEVDLNVTGAGGTISGAVSGTALAGGGQLPNFVLLNATTAGGNITIQDLPPTSTNLVLGTLNAGTGTIQLAVNGTVYAGALLDVVFDQPPYNLLPNPYSSYANAINLTAGAVDLTTTGPGSAIGFPDYPITTQSGSGQSLKLTAATNDGSVYIQDHSPAGLTINSIVADQQGQAPIVSNGQVVYNDTPDSSSPAYVSGQSDVVINSPVINSQDGYRPVGEPVTVNSISATGSVAIYGEYILEGNALSPNIISQNVALVAVGFAEYKGQVTFAQASTGDTLTLPNGELWSNQFFFNVSDNTIVVSGALSRADDGVFAIASISGSTLTLKQSYALIPEEDYVSVGDGMIGLANAPISLSDVPLFLANTSNGNIDLAAGMDSTAHYVNAGGGPANNMANDVSVTSQADFLAVEGIFATGEAAVTMNSGVLVEADGGTIIDFAGSPVALSGIIAGQTVSLTGPYNIGTASTPLRVDATSGLSVDATATSPASAGIYIEDTATSALAAVEVSTYDGSVTILSAAGGELSFRNSVLSETFGAVVDFANTDDADGSAGDVIVSGTVHVSSITAGISADGTAGAGQILTNPTTSGLITGIGGPSSMIMLLAGSGIGSNSATPVDISNVAILDASTDTGGVYIANGGASGTLTLSASTSAGNIDVKWNGTIDLGSELSSAAGIVLASISATGTVSLNAVGGAIADENDSTVSARTLSLTATAGIGTAGSPVKTTSRGILALTAAAGGGLFVDSSAALTVDSATAGNGDLSIRAAGNLTLLSTVDDPTRNVTLTATAGALATGNVTTSTRPITTTGQLAVTPIVMETYITPGAVLLIDAGQPDQETVTVTRGDRDQLHGHIRDHACGQFHHRHGNHGKLRQRRQRRSDKRRHPHDHRGADWLAEGHYSNQRNDHKRHGELRRHLPG